MSGEKKARDVELTWGNVQDLPLNFVNQIVAQLGAPAGPEQVPDGIIVILGHAAPPVIVGSEEAIQRQVDALSSVQVQPLGRFVMSRERAEELLQVLAQSVAQYDEIVAGAKHARA